MITDIDGLRGRELGSLYLYGISQNPHLEELRASVTDHKKGNTIYLDKFLLIGFLITINRPVTCPYRLPWRILS